MGYNRRFAFGGDTAADLRSDLAAGREREMPEADIQGLCAYLGGATHLHPSLTPG